MNTTLHCTNYDDQLKASLSHLESYPQYLPFIGTAWDSLPERILFIGESHYLPKTSNGKSKSETWYTRTWQDLTELDHGHICTRSVIDSAENGEHNNAFRIFYNIKAVVRDVHKLRNSGTLFQNFAFYNYFQRPAETTGASIINQTIDNEVAYNTLKVLVETIKPTVVIFVSKKAFLSFQAENWRQKHEVFKTIKPHHVPHPASAWWHRRSGDKKTTGKERFTNIIKGLNATFNVE